MENRKEGHTWEIRQKVNAISGSEFGLPQHFVRYCWTTRQRELSVFDFVILLVCYGDNKDVSYVIESASFTL